MVATEPTASRRSRAVRNTALIAALVALLGVGAWATWAVIDRDAGQEIADGDGHPGSDKSPSGAPQPVDLQPVRAELEPAAAVQADSDAIATNELAPLLFESAPVVVVTAENADAKSEGVEVAQQLAAPILVASADDELSEILADLSTRAVLRSGPELDLPNEVAQIEISANWREDLRAELGPVIEAEPISDPQSRAFFEAEEGSLPLAEVTASAAGFAAEYVKTISLLATAPDLTKVSQLLVVSADPPETQTLKWQYAVLNQEKTLPGGGYELFDGKRYVALYGSPDVPALGVLGQRDLDGAIKLAQKYADKYQKLTDDAVIPTFEVIATVASAGAGQDGQYSNRLPVDKLRPWVEAAGEAGYYVLLDLQPGRTDFLTQAKEYRQLLELPHVGLALDPEWRLKKDQKLLQQIGSVRAKEVNEVSDWLAELVRKEGLPPKMLVLHQFSLSMIKDRAEVAVDHPELSVVIHADGQGTQQAKTDTWTTLHSNAPAVTGWGWKNFLKEDHPVLSPKETYKIDPVPELVTYQ